MGGKRAPFHITERDGSPFWQFSATINGQSVRESLTTRIADDPNKRKAGPEAGARYHTHCSRLGAKAPPGVVETDTFALISLYVDTELAARARRRGERYAEIEETRLIRYVKTKFPTVDVITTRAWDIAQQEFHAKGVKLATLQRATVSLRMFLKWCAGVGAIVAVPHLNAPSGPEVALEAPERRALDEAERDRLLAELAKLDARAHRIYTALLYTALRKGALGKLVPRWIRGDRVTFPTGTLKNKKPRSFFLHPKARAAIAAELLASGERGDDVPVFGPFDYDGHNGAKRAGLFWTACRKAQIPLRGLTAHHVTRHTALTIAGNRGASLAALMALSGHETPAMVMRYLHLDAEQSRIAAELL